MTTTTGSFRRCNLFELDLQQVDAHAGRGEVAAARVAYADALGGSCRFIDYVELTPGSSIGDHTHASDEEEYYLILDGSGRMRLDDEVFDVGRGDLVRNRPRGRHGLENTSNGTLALFVFEVTACA